MDMLLERLAQANAALRAVRDDYPADTASKDDHDDFRAREARAEQAVAEAWQAIANRWDDLVYHVEKQNQLIATCVSNMSQTNRFDSREQWEDERRWVIEDLMPEATRRLIVLTALRTDLEEMGYPDAAAIGRAPSGAGAGLELLAWDREPPDQPPLGCQIGEESVARPASTPVQRGGAVYTNGVLAAGVAHRPAECPRTFR